LAIWAKASKQQILRTLHEGHSGVTATKTKAREFFFWIGMDFDIENFIAQCDLCQKYQKSNQKEPMIERDLAERPWEKIGADFFHLRGKNFLLVIDYFTKYVEMEEMSTSTSLEFVHQALQKIYSRHGLPDQLITDRGPPFNSYKFKEINSEYNIFHDPSSPKYPKSNGLIERTVQTIKTSMKKAMDEGKNYFNVILNHNSTPHNDLPSPAELLFGRRIKTNNIIHPDLLKPKYSIEKAINQQQVNKKKQKKYYDQHVKKLSQSVIKFGFKKILNLSGWKEKSSVLIIKTDPIFYKLRTELNTQEIVFF